MPRGYPGTGKTATKKSTSRARSSSVGSNRSRASSVGSRKSTGSRRSRPATALVDKGSYKVGFDVGNALNPLTPDVHSFPMTRWKCKTAKAKNVLSTLISSATGTFIVCTSGQTQGQQNALNPEVYIHNGTIASSMLAAHPFTTGNTGNSTEGIRRCSCALEIIYTGRADAASGYLTIGGSMLPTTYDEALDLDTAGEIAVLAGQMASHPETVQIPIAAVAIKGSLVLMPKPIGEQAERWSNAVWQCPVQANAQADTQQGGWEALTVIGQGFDSSSSFLIRWHQVIEARVGYNSPLAPFQTPYKMTALNPLADESLAMSAFKSAAKAIGAAFDPHETSITYSLLDKGASALVNALLNRRDSLMLGN